MASMPLSTLRRVEEVAAGDGQVDGDGGSLSFSAVDLYGAAMLVDDEVADKKPQAGPGAAGFGGIKRVEDVRQLVGRNATACVRKANAESALVAARCGLDRHAGGELAAIR